MRFTVLSSLWLVAMGWLSLPLAAQITRSASPTRLTVAVGLSETVGAGSPIWTNDGTQPLVGPAGDGFHIAFGVARAIQGSALELRGEALYSRVTGGHTTYLGVDYGSGLARMAQRAESYALLAGLTWGAFPDGHWTPYLITAMGLYHARLGTNPNDQDARVTETYSATDPGVNAGAGILVRLGSREGFFEVRRHELLRSEQSGPYATLSLGLRW